MTVARPATCCTWTVPSGSTSTRAASFVSYTARGVTSRLPPSVNFAVTLSRGVAPFATVAAAGSTSIATTEASSAEGGVAPCSIQRRIAAYSGDERSSLRPPPWVTLAEALRSRRLSSGAATEIRRPRASLTMCS